MSSFENASFVKVVCFLKTRWEIQWLIVINMLDDIWTLYIKCGERQMLQPVGLRYPAPHPTSVEENDKLVTKEKAN